MKASIFQLLTLLIFALVATIPSPAFTATFPSTATAGDRSMIQLKTGTEPSWSPDSKRIAFSAGHFPEGREIYVINAHGGNLKQLTQNSFADEYPMWSPDGKRILFSTNKEGGWKLYLMGADGTNPKSLGIETSTDPNDPCRAAWSPDGKRIIFPVTRDGKRQIFIANADGSNVTVLTTINANYPQWSPDGKTIAVYNADERNIYLVTVDGAILTKLTAEKQRPSMTNYPSWSRDATRIFFIESDGTQADVYSIRRDGSDKKKLTSRAGRKFYALASPNGKEVVYMTYNPDDKLDQLFIINLAGSSELRLLN